jgi:hypothetical protein
MMLDKVTNLLNVIPFLFIISSLMNQKIAGYRVLYSQDS